VATTDGTTIPRSNDQQAEKLAIARRILKKARADLDGASELKPQIAHSSPAQ
jgi:hypothetical protein